MEQKIERIPKNVDSTIMDLCYDRSFPIRGLLDLSYEEENDFFATCLKKGYEAVRSSILSMRDIQDSGSGNLSTTLSRLLKKAVDYEKPNINSLEKACVDEIVELFSIPEDTVDFSTNLMDMFSWDDKIIQLEPEDSPIDFNDYKEVQGFRYETGRRHINNMIIAGAASYYTVQILFRMYESGKMPKEALELYTQIIVLNDYLLFSTPDMGLSEDNKKEMGYVNVILGDDETKTMIKTVAKIFPALVYETVKGILELVSSHALPSDRSLADAVMKKTDCVENEVWYMRFGPALWENLRKCLDDKETGNVPYIISDIMKLPKMKYNRFMKELFNGTKKAKRIVDSISDMEKYDEFAKKMTARKNEKNIIEDEFIHPEEL